MTEQPQAQPPSESTVEERLLQAQQEQIALLKKIAGSTGTISSIIVLLFILTLILGACTVLGSL